ncbi:MAG TPA: hypothetical protein VFE16_08490 [Candidatus Cybelea sp.]|jgi:hypothetical protein|nr:hypothetical protein [Candidatus Cybelea sp.]
MIRYAVPAAAMMVWLAGADAPRASADATLVPSVVLRASAVFDMQMRGVVGMQRHFTTQINAGPLTHSEQSESGQIVLDGRFVKIAYYHIERDGHALSASQIQQRNDETNANWSAGKVFFKEPYDSRYLSDYSFVQQAACAACSTGTLGVSFASTIHDSQHGSGVMYVDSTSAHVVKLTYTPYVLPPHASAGSVTETGGQALPDLWCVMRIDETYEGHAFMIRGSGTFAGVFDNFRRYLSLSAAEADLQDHTL